MFHKVLLQGFVILPRGLVQKLDADSFGVKVTGKIMTEPGEVRLLGREVRDLGQVIFERIRGPTLFRGLEVFQGGKEGRPGQERGIDGLINCLSDLAFQRIQVRKRDLCPRVPQG